MTERVSVSSLVDRLSKSFAIIESRKPADAIEVLPTYAKRAQEVFRAASKIEKGSVYVLQGNREIIAEQVQKIETRLAPIATPGQMSSLQQVKRTWGLGLN